jgi:Ca-activated chloride channel family protein
MKSILCLLFLGMATVAGAQPQPAVTITQKPSGLVHGELLVPLSSRADVAKMVLSINGVPFAERTGRSVDISVPVGNYIRRLRIKAEGFDASGRRLGEDEMAVNDPQPPFTIHLEGPVDLPPSGMAHLTANVSPPQGDTVSEVDFYFGETKIGTATEPPWSVAFDVSAVPPAQFATATAKTTGGHEANDVYFWGSNPGETIDVNLQQLPLSVAAPAGFPPLRKEELALVDDGSPRPIERLVPAADLPLHVILLIDSSESMLTELPLVKKAAGDFARVLVGPTQQVAVVAFAQRTVWLTPFTSNAADVDRAVQHLYPRGETHLYDAAIEMLFELQKIPGRKALVVLTDGVNQGGDFNLDHLVHYARYAGVPLYPVIKNSLLTRFLRFGLGGFQVSQFADIARDSGATYFIVRGGAELPGVYRRVAEELRQQYILVFYGAAAASDNWHSLALKSSRPNLPIRIQRGYFP